MSFLYSDVVNSALSYKTYRNEINNLLKNHLADDVSNKMLPYIRTHAGLMEKYDQTYAVTSQLKQILQDAPPAIWIVITEAWCGDAAYNIPMFSAIEKFIPRKIKLCLVLRDSNLDLVDAHLTDGARSIPKLIALSHDLQNIGVWGPRPAPVQTLTKEWKAAGVPLKDLISNMHDWYEADATQTLQGELGNMIQQYSQIGKELRS